MQRFQRFLLDNSSKFLYICPWIFAATNTADGDSKDVFYWHRRLNMAENTENNIDLKSVSELLGMKFFIPSYQRGYRWTRLQIDNLLMDIYKFNKGVDGDFYCLQPLVVKKRTKETLEEIKQAKSIEEVKAILKGEWIVIDGQQRLTTIYLILKALEIDKTPTLEYERESYIKKCDERNVVDYSNIEVYHLTKAKDFIDKWIHLEKRKEEEKDLINPNNIRINPDEFRTKLLEQTKFIFYNVGDVSEEQEHDIFNNLNSGTIALTNAELIKALFLNKVGKEDIAHREVEQRLLADEFDQIERTLRQDDFWYFLAGNAEKPSSCINLLFDLMLAASNKNNQYSIEEPLRTFFYFNDLINGDREPYKKSKDSWEDVRKVFHIMEGWFNDSEMYNLIGYHRAAKGGKILCEIYQKFCKTESKNEFKKWLVDECQNLINYQDDNFMSLRYDDNRDKVFNLLLLFNISTLNERPQEAVKFSFANLHKYNWDIEHISPQNPQNIEQVTKELEKGNENGNGIFTDLLKKINNGESYDTELDKFFAIGDELMAIGNLTLLIAHVNRGIGNKFFFRKRQKLQEYYQQGSFIPACSMNVFMKFYSSNPKQMAFWDGNDRDSYKAKIEQTIKKFFGNE